MEQAAVSVREVSKVFRLYRERNQFIKAAVLRGRRARYDEFWALTDVTFDVPKGSTFGIIGSNGSGKSTLLKCLSGILFPERGHISVDGKLAALLELGAGFHPELSGSENIYLNASILGMSKRDIERRFDDIVEFSGLSKFIDTPVKNYSSGMVIRLGFAIACHVEPEVLLIDEILSVGDASFQRKSGEKIEQFRRDGRTIVVVSHSLPSLHQICDQLVWLEAGHVRMIGDPEPVISEYTGSSYSGVEHVPDQLGEKWGSGEVAIVSAELLDAADAPATKFTSGGTMKIKVVATTHLDLEAVSMRLTIAHLNGTPIWSTSSIRSGKRIPNRQGHITASAVLKSLPLLEGTFLVSVAVTDEVENREYIHWKDCLRFDVHQTALSNDGLVDINCNWLLK